MKSLNIECPPGYVIDEEQSNLLQGTIKFKAEPKFSSYKDIVDKLFIGKRVYFIHEGEITSTEVENIDVIADMDNAINKEQLESLFALNKLINVAKYFNGDWLPTNNDINWFVSKKGENLFIFNHKTVHYSCIYFKKKDHLQAAIKILGEEEVRKALTLQH